MNFMSEGTKSEGTGLGFPIARSIVESHGGRILAIASSRFDVIFQFMLPQDLAAQA